MKAKIIADSINNGNRITTFELEYPRFIHAEFLTHRQFSRNSASSRAIPISKMIDIVKTNPATPIHWGQNQAGMQAQSEIDDIQQAKDAWLNASTGAVVNAIKLNELGLHKQIVNRVLEPFSMMKTVVTATNYANFFVLRCHKDAQPEIKALADLMFETITNSEPVELSADDWHLPYYQNGYWQKGIHDHDIKDALAFSASCCAQVSYRTLDRTLEKARAIYKRLVESKPIHASPFEHQATPIFDAWQNGVTHKKTDGTLCSGNFENWVQYRQILGDNK